MNKAGRTERLHRYYDLLSEKPLEEQAEIIEKKRSGDAMRALLSGEAPVELVERFSHRFAEVMDKHFSSYERGRICATRGEFKFARDNFEVAMFNGDKRGLVGIADMLPYMMDLEKMNFLKYAIGSGVDMADAYAKLGELLLIREQTDSAVDYLIMARDKSISSIIKRFYEAEILWNSGKKKEALEIYRELADKGHFKSIEKLVALYSEWGEQEQSVKILRNGIACGYNILLLNLARVYDEIGDYESAGETYVEAFEAGYSSVIMDAVKHLINEGAYDKAFDFCKRAIDENMAEGHMAAVKIYSVLKQEDLMMLHLRTAINMGYNVSFEVEFGLLMREGDTEGAIDLCEEIVKKNPSYYFFLASLYKLHGDDEKAGKAYEQAIIQNDLMEATRIVAELQAAGRDYEANQLLGSIIVEHMTIDMLPEFRNVFMQHLGIDELN